MPLQMCLVCQIIVISSEHQNVPARNLPDMVVSCQEIKSAYDRVTWNVPKLQLMVVTGSPARRNGMPRQETPGNSWYDCQWVTVDGICEYQIFNGSINDGDAG